MWVSAAGARLLVSTLQVLFTKVSGWSTTVCVPDLQGCFLSSANVCVVKVEGTPHLCKTDEVGEICVDSSATATAYYGLLGITKNVFEVPAGPTAVVGGRARREGVWPSSGCLQP